MRIERYQCVICRFIREIPRNRNLRAKKHKKSMFCPFCKKYRRLFIKIDD